MGVFCCFAKGKQQQILTYKKMRRLIVTADDYGMCEVVDKAIDDCEEAGLLTSTNVIVNMED